MKTLKSTLYALLLLVVISPAHSETPAQRNALPPELNPNSTVREILAYLNETAFPYARIGLKSSLPGDPEFWDADTGLYSRASSSYIFSQGFKLAPEADVEADDCHVKLKNDDVKLYDAGRKDVGLIDLGKVTKTPPPHAAEFPIWLETVSYDKGKAQFVHTKNPDIAKLVGAWQTEFQSRGFFRQTIFGVRFPALKPDDPNEYMMSNTVTFAFDDKQTGERFNAAFRRLIKLCQPRSTKPRWNR